MEIDSADSDKELLGYLGAFQTSRKQTEYF
jgi:hypothetical protein